MFVKEKDMDPVFSGTRVFYQVMPAVGADGKNIMKLIPVQMFNGQFVQTQISKPKTNPEPQKAVTLKTAQAPVDMVSMTALTASAPQQTITTPGVPSVNASSNQAGGTGNCTNLLSKNLLQQQTLNLATNVPHMATLSKSVRLPGLFPVTGKSTALSRGHKRRFPLNVSTVPSSRPPSCVRGQNITSSVNSSATSGQSTVAYVSPVTTLDPGVVPTNPARHSLQQLSVASDKPTCGPSTPKRPKPHLKLIPKFSQRPNSPIKWVIEEENGSVAQTLDPLNSPSVTSEILRAVAKREKGNRHSEAITKQTAICQASPAKSGQTQENSLVMCNGKVFFVAKKCTLPLTMTKGTDESTPKNSEFKDTSIPSNKYQMKEATMIPRDLDEVIDLCDDDSHEDLPQTASMTSADEDNVIFVSYKPPKSKRGSSEDMTEKPSEKHTAQMAVTSSDQNENNCAASLRKVISDAETNSTDVHDSSTVTTDGDDASDKDSQQSMDHSRCSETEMETHNMECSTNPTPCLTHPPEPCPMADHVLRQTFGIIDDVKICLQRIHVNRTGTSQRRSGNTHVQKTVGRLKEKEGDCSELDMNVAADHTSPGLHTEVSPLKCLKLKTDMPITVNKCHVGQSSHIGTLGDVEAEPVIGYIEPIDEDFPTTDEKENPKTQTCVDLNTNPRSVGRMRKRTLCPCCTFGDLDPTVKSSAKLEGADEQTWTSEKSGTKGGSVSTKTQRKDGRASGKIGFVRVRNKRIKRTCDTQVIGSFSPVDMDFDEIKLHKQIQRLKGLLKEKEAALEKMRNTTG